MPMTNTTTRCSNPPNPKVPRQTGPFTGIIVLLIGLPILAALSFGGDLLENGMTLSQDEISKLSSQEPNSRYCPMPATLRLYLPDLSKRGEAAWI
jgi:hypothetical protein